MEVESMLTKLDGIKGDLGQYKNAPAEVKKLVDTLMLQIDQSSDLATADLEPEDVEDIQVSEEVLTKELSANQVIQKKLESLMKY